MLLLEICSVNCKVSPIVYKIKIHKDGFREMLHRRHLYTKVDSIIQITTAGNNSDDHPLAFHKAMWYSRAVELFPPERIEL